MKCVYNLSRDGPCDDDVIKQMNLKLGKHTKSIMSIDHRKTCPEVYLQGDIGSCTSSALCCIYYHNLIEFGYKDIFLPSRLFIYYNTRMMNHSINIDNGGSIRDALKAMHAYGVCPEKMWKYNNDNFAVSPSPEAYDFGRHHKSIIYARVPQDIIQLKQCLIEGYLFAFGMSVYSNFESDETEKTGILNMPSENDVYKGGHAVCAVGFDDEKSIFIVRNSWGDQWGDHGYFYLPYAYMLDKNLVYDIWAFRNGKETFTLTIETKKKRNVCTII